MLSEEKKESEVESKSAEETKSQESFPEETSKTDKHTTSSEKDSDSVSDAAATAMKAAEIAAEAAEEAEAAAKAAIERANDAKAKAEAEMEKLATGFSKTDSGLRYQVLQEGQGTKAEKGKTVSVHYKGQLADGTVFDSSYKRNQPIDFALGVGQVIPGWDEGIQLLKVGDKARFVIPSDLAYGSAGAGGVIPPDATLIFDVELMNVK